MLAEGKLSQAVVNVARSFRTGAREADMGAGHVVNVVRTSHMYNQNKNT